MDHPDTKAFVEGNGRHPVGLGSISSNGPTTGPKLMDRCQAVQVEEIIETKEPHEDSLVDDLNGV